MWLTSSSFMMASMTQAATRARRLVIVSLALLAPGFAACARQGGVVAGAIIGTAIANHDGYYRYDDYADAPRGCYWARKAWRDPDGYVHYGRPRQFCD